MAREKMLADQAFRDAQLSAQYGNQSPDKNVVDYINAYGAIIGDGSKSYDEKKHLLRGLAGQVSSYGTYTGTDLSSLLNDINQYETNYTGFTERPWIGSSEGILSPKKK